jgi:type I restriction enzyme S subunit
MIADLKPYPAMKDSGVPWLEHVPEHWAVHRLRDSVEACINGIWGNEPNGRDDLPCVRVADFDRQSLRVRLAHPTIRAITPSERGRRLLKKGDLLLEKSGGGDQQPVGVVVLYEHDVPAVCSNFVARMPLSDGFDSCYVTYLHAFLYAIRLNIRSIKQTIGIQNLDSAAYLSESVAFPPLNEQELIARYLDYMDRDIRQCIRGKQKLIKLLEEQKRGIVHRTVTHGLDPNVRLNPSGVEWLGNVPEHWEVVPLKFLSRRIQNGATPPTSEEFFYEGGTTPWFGPSSIGTSVEVSAPVRYLADSAFVAGKARLIQGPAVLIVVIGATAGRMALLSGEGSTNQQLTAFELRTDVVMPEFAIHQLRSAENWLRATASTATIPILDSGTVSRLSVAVPPLFDEQAAIVSFLEDATANIDSTINRAKQEISLLGEYRARLIADVVTGKLDVREAAANLPDEISQEETVLDDAAEWFEDDLEDSDSSVEVALEEVDA